MNHKTFLHRIMLILASIIVALLLAELGARIHSNLSKTHKRTKDTIHSAYYYNKNGLLCLKPYASGWHRGYDKEPILIKTNSLGFRGPELQKTYQNRILFIGDSIVFNAGVKLEETFTSLIEGYFKNDGLNVEIINAGMTS